MAEDWAAGLQWLGARFRPIERWPGDLTHDRRRSAFSSPWGHTTRLLERELTYLGATNIVVQIAVDESRIRLDGYPRASAVAHHPGVVLAFDSKHGPLQYAVDTFDRWRDNVRAIALALEALRKVDRYGVTRHGEQYTGWKAIGSGIPLGAAMTADEAAKLLADACDDVSPADVIDSLDARRRAYRAAVELVHPDKGGDHERFLLISQAKQVLDRHG